MTIKIRLVVFTAYCLFSVFTIFGQAQKITEAEYLAAEAEAVAKISARPRRIVRSEQYKSGEEITGNRKLIFEYLGPDAQRHVSSENFGRKNAARENVKLGEKYFCRQDRENWKLSNDSCVEDRPLHIPDGIYEYSAIPDPKNPSVTLYIRRAEFPKSAALKKAGSGLDFAEFRFWINESGIVGRREFRSGKLDSREWQSIVDTSYELDPRDIEIKSPIE